MNIFVVNGDPVSAARDLCDRHVVKMVLETAQMLCAAFPDGKAPYKKTHARHPCTLWAARSEDNFIWLSDHGIGLCEEYTRRYRRIHKSTEIIEWCRKNRDMCGLPDIGLTPFAQAMPDQYKHEDAVMAYRQYYLAEKSKIAKWKHGNAPDWFLRGNLLLNREIMA
jgi:hypothetical protein